MREIFNCQKTFFLTDKTKDYHFRIEQLKKLRSLILDYEKEITNALFLDLNKSSFEAYSTEIGFCLHSLSRTIRELKKWMRPKKVKTPIYQLNTKSYIMPEPKGVILIIGPYNYPFQLVIEPLIGAIASGNTVILKPSEYAKETEKVLEKMINTHFDEQIIHLFSGDQQITSELLTYPFDHIFFTGSTKVGQIIYEAASKNLVPVTLELGGKSPTIVDETANIKVAARRIAFGKCMNAGQTCIAPDYLYVHESIHDAFIKELNHVMITMYQHESAFGKIINERHFNRLLRLIDQKKAVSEVKLSEKDRLIHPVILRDVTWDDPIMKEEIFGPLLPVLSYKNLDDVIQIIKKQEKPLALYLFTTNKEHMNKVWTSISFGGGAINDTLMHIANPYLPFGGVGQSGMGAYHGKHSFDLFSHHKSFIKRKTWFDPPMAYPPYSKNKEKLIRNILK